jgi:AcrR family transcriptional regulator
VAENAPATRPSPGRRRLSREFVAQHQRARIIAALGEESQDKGYRAVTVADIVRRAGIARNTFYENFSSKEACYLAAAEFGIEGVLERVMAAAERVESWPARVNAGLAAFLGYVVSEPALARICIVEGLAAGPAAADRYERSIHAFVPLMRMGRKISPHGEALPSTLEETVIGGIFWIVYQRFALRQVGEIEALRGELVEFALTPYIGAEAARRVAATPPTPLS